MNLRSACLATAAVYRQQAEQEPGRRTFLLAQADKWTERASTQLRLTIRIEPTGRADNDRARELQPDTGWRDASCPARGSQNAARETA